MCKLLPFSAPKYFRAKHDEFYRSRLTGQHLKVLSCIFLTVSYFQVPSLSLAEFACAPQLSPTSMYLTVPRGKNVSIVCRVSSDPISSVAWFFNGKRIAEEEEDDTKQQPHQLLQHQHQVQQVGRVCPCVCSVGVEALTQSTRAEQLKLPTPVK